MKRRHHNIRWKTPFSFSLPGDSVPEKATKVRLQRLLGCADCCCWHEVAVLKTKNLKEAASKHLDQRTANQESVSGFFLNCFSSFSVPEPKKNSSVVQQQNFPPKQKDKVQNLIPSGKDENVHLHQHLSGVKALVSHSKRKRCATQALQQQTKKRKRTSKQTRRKCMRSTRTVSK